MKKSLIVATAAAVIAGSAFVYTAYAQQPGWNPMHWRQSAADMSAYADAHIAALKAGLALNPEQEKLWPPVESAMRDLAKKRIDRMQQFHAERESRSVPSDPIARLRRGAELMTETGADLKRLADAAQPLHDQLDDAQKRRLAVLTRRGMGGHGMSGHGMGGPGMHHRGMGWRHGSYGEREHAMRWRGHGHDDMGWQGRHGDDGEGRRGQDSRGERL